LTEELVRQGHDVTLFASGDSQTKAELVASVPRALRLNPAVKDLLPYYAWTAGKTGKTDRIQRYLDDSASSQRFAPGRYVGVDGHQFHQLLANRL
jgi:hypothetical protein